MKQTHTSSTAQGGGGSLKDRKPIQEVVSCELRMAERTSVDRKVVRVSGYLSISLSVYLSICLSIYLSS